MFNVTANIAAPSEGSSRVLYSSPVSSLIIVAATIKQAVLTLEEEKKCFGKNPLCVCRGEIGEVQLCYEQG